MQRRSRRHLRSILSIMVIQTNEKSTSFTTKNKNLDVVTGTKRFSTVPEDYNKVSLTATYQSPGIQTKLGVGRRR